MRLSFRLVFGLLIPAAIAAARDVNQPVNRGNLEVGLGYSYTRITGYFDSTGEYTRYPNGYAPAGHGIPVRLKYGVGGGFDFKLEWERFYANVDAGNAVGFSQPKLGARYIRPLAGVTLTYTPPWATEDFDTPNLKSDLEIAGLLRKKTENFRLTLLGAYARNSGSANAYDLISKGNNSRFRFSFTPTYLWGNGVEAYGTLEYARGVEIDAFLMSLNPGVRVDLSKDLYVDLSFPHSLAGRSAAGGVSPVGWSARAIAYWTPGR